MIDANKIDNISADNILIGLEASRKGWRWIVSNIIYFASFSDCWYHKK